jgi:hypothetical protein
MTPPPAQPEPNDLPPAGEDKQPGPAIWMIAGCALVLVYIAILALLHPAA